MLYEINKKDVEILSLLRMNCRESLTQMSKQTRMPISTIYDRLKKFRKGLIRKYALLINFQELGFNARANVMIKAKRKEELLDFLLRHQNVNSLSKINNGFDYMIDIIFGNIKQLEEFIEFIKEEYQLKLHTYYIIDEIKNEEFLSRSNNHEVIFARENQ